LGQVVENIFYISFNIQDARARLEIDGGMPIVSAVEDALTDPESKMENRPCIIDITMSLWEVFHSFNWTLY
jgi:Nse4 C-terminal